MFYVFVYGTLKFGQRNHHVLTCAEFVGNVRTEPKYKLVDLGMCPGLLQDPENGKSIVGELYKVDELLLERLDRIEGHPHSYRREPIAIQGMDDDITVFGYLFQRTDRLRHQADCGDEWPVVHEESQFPTT